MLIDTHCHLDAAEFDADRDAVYAAALAAGVGRIIVPGVTVNRKFRPKLKIADYPACHEAYGIHPLYVDQSSPEDLVRLRDWLQQAPPVAVGEIGLDFFVSGVDVERQTHFFVEQLKLAREFDLPVILHVRRAVDSVLKQLRRIGVRGGIAHAFNGSRQQADEFIKLGFVLGFGGAMTYNGSTRIRELARTLPLESIVLETDAPDMSPAWLNGGRNTPAELPRIADVLAELRGLSRAEVALATSDNAERILTCI
jgi:TatD DNase family protein